ncbi:MAG: glycosyltransferase, partial [Bacteroidetes bacterium]|nr:glycosyltransferase [Bacteroidota bacterium]
LIEAQAAGRFIVSTNVGGIKDILQKGAGLLSEPGDLAPFRDNLLNAITNFETSNNNSEAIRRAVLQNFSYQRLCSDMDKLYRKLLLRKH